MNYPNTDHPKESSPNDITEGISIWTLTPIVSPKEQVIINGLFMISEEDVASVGGKPHRVLVLAINKVGLYQTVSPFRDVLLFDDDDFSINGLRHGYFNFDLFSTNAFETLGAYFITVSLGYHLSNTLEINVKKKK